MSPKQLGTLVELQCITAFCELGYHVSIPYGEDSRYDFIADLDGSLIRVQVKKSKKIQDSNGIIFSCQSTKSNKRTGVSRRKYTEKEIDFFATYYENKCYLIPVKECSAQKCLRFDSKNNQHQNINIASDYELEKQINKFLEHC